MPFAAARLGLDYWVPACACNNNNQQKLFGWLSGQKNAGKWPMPGSQPLSYFSGKLRCLCHV